MDSKSDCFTKLKELQDKLRKTEYEYIDVSIIERKIHYNALNRMELLNKEIKKLSQICNNLKE
jgi:hypothetical protein